MAIRTTSGRRGIPVTEHPRASSEGNNNAARRRAELSPPKTSAPLKTLSPLEQWMTDREKKAIGNPEWYIYDDYIKRLVSEMNHHLSTSKNVENYKPLDWKWIKAMIWTETGATVAAWRTRTMQIGNTGDDGIDEVAIPARPRKHNIIVPQTWHSLLKNQQDLIRSNPEYNIRAGIALLMIKMADQEKDKTVYDDDKEHLYTVIKGDMGYSAIAKKIGTTIGVLKTLNGDKILHPGDKLKYKKAHIEQYIPGWSLFTAENIKKQYNGDPAKAKAGHRGDKHYAAKIKFLYDLITADELKNQ